MKLEDFIAALYRAGWDARADGQHTRIAELHKELFPVVASLEAELKDTEKECFRLLKGK